MSVSQVATPKRRPYASPVLRSYGSIVATTRGSVGTKGDGGTKRTN